MGEVGLDDCRPNGGTDSDSIEHHVFESLINAYVAHKNGY